MENRVCIVGIGLLESHEPRTELSHKELLFYATKNALDDAGVKRKDINGAVTNTFDFLEGRSLSNQYTLDSIGGVMKPCDLRLGEDGIYGLFAGYMEVMTDPSQLVVVASVQKASERDPEGLGYQKLIAGSMEPLFSRPVCNSIPNLLLLEPILAAMEARVYMHQTGLSEEHLAQVALKNMRNADSTNNRLTDLEAILESDVLSWPIRKMTKAKETDGACALILTSEKKAKALVQEPVYIRGVGWCSGQSHFASRQMGVAIETKWAAHQAYGMAGIRNPERQIDVAEISDWYPHRELMHCEALGFSRPDEISARISDAFFDKGGPLPVNVSGGLLGRGNIIGTSGLIRVAQIALQIRGQAGSHQVSGVNVGLAQSWGGIPGATAGVVILGKW
jgi:acetyl-CoA C-acetyltransferase